MNSTRRIAFVLGVLAGHVSVGLGQSVPLFKQDRDGEPARQMSAAELAELNDPFFVVVLKGQNHPTTLSEVEEQLQPDPTKRSIFVVHEDIKNDRRGQSRRAVIAFSGQRADGIVLDTNVMLSVFFGSEQFSDPANIEAWGWDGHLGRYNYYKLDNSGTPTMQRTWKFRGSSVGSDQLNEHDRRNTCMACHVNGAPIMKELLFPWNNWHSDVSRSPADYLKAGSPNTWPVANQPRLKDSLTDAFKLEQSLIAATHQFNRRRINAALRRRENDGNIETLNDGRQTLVEGRRLLRSLFVTTEYNIISARERSGLHGLPELDRSGPPGSVAIPDSFFLNAELLSGGGQAPGLSGLGIQEAKQFGEFAKVEPAEYKSLVLDSNLLLHGRVSDAHFAWLTPEPSLVDNDLVDQLMSRGIVSPQFVAACLAIDLEIPVLSAKRAALWRFVPDRFTFQPIQPTESHLDMNTHPDDLTRLTISAVEAANPAAGSPEADWLDLLRAPDPLNVLRERVVTYRDRVKENLGDAGRRQSELKRLFDQLIERRRAVNSDTVLGNLDETGGRRLFPVPVE